MNTRYNATFRPPAPTIASKLRAPGRGAWFDIEALIDSGSDLCGVPIEVANALDLPQVRRVPAVGFEGTVSQVIVYRMDIVLGRKRFLRAEALGLVRPYALIGRNVLNELVVELNGPARTLTLR